MRFDRSDYGIIFYAVCEDTTAPTYVDVLGQTRQALVLDGSTKQQMPAAYESAYPTVGSGKIFTLEVEFSTAGGFAVDLNLAGHASADPADPFAALVTIRNDTVPVETQAVHSFTSAGLYILQTTNLAAVYQAAMQATQTSGGDDGAIIVRLRVER